MSEELLAFVIGLGLGCGLGLWLVVVLTSQLKYLRAVNADMLDRFMVRNLAEYKAVKQEDNDAPETQQLFVRDDTGLIESVSDARPD